MDDTDRRDDEEPLAYRTGQIRIIGAEPVGEATPEEPVTPEAVTNGPDEVDPVPAAEPQHAAAEPVGGAELPHWTEAPTGEVPAVLARESDPSAPADQWSSMSGPTWREEQSDWTAHEETYEPSMLADDEVALGTLGNAGEQERQPWTFELDESPSTPAGPAAYVDPLIEGAEYSDEDTVIVPAVRVVAEPPAPTATPDPYTGPGSGFRAGAPRVVVPDVDQDVAAVSGAAMGAAAGAAAGVEAGPDAEAFDDRDGYEEPRSRLGRMGGRRDRRRNQAAPAGGAVADDPTTPSRPPVAPSGSPGAGRPPLRPPTVPTAAAADSVVTSGRNMPLAIGIGVVLFLLVLVLFDLGTVFAMLISTVVVFLGAAEGYAAFRRGGYHPATLLGLAATLSLMLATYNKGLAALPLVIVLLVAFSFIWYMAGVERTDPVAGTGATLLVFCWVSVFGSFAGLLLNPNLFPHRHGIAFLLGAVITSVACDVGSLAVGRAFGRHPLARSISPNKTWEGAIGGGLLAIAVAVIVVHFIHPWDLGNAAALGVVVAIVSPLGDLCESMIKRTLGLKDMGRILPGHGGILDRVDGLLFVLPATYFLVKALHLG